MPEWSVEVVSGRAMDKDTLLLFSMVPGEEKRKSGLAEAVFWQETRKKLAGKAKLYHMPYQAVDAYIRDAMRNPENRIALVLRY